jgi:hypothetical protein
MGASKKTASPAGRREQGKADRLIEAGKSTRWQPGQSGNPVGAKRDYVTHHLRELLNAATAKKLAGTLLKMGLKGNLAAIREVLDRADGKPAISIGGVPGEPLEVTTAMPTTPEECDKRILEILSDWAERGGYVLKVIKKKPRASK